MPPLPRELPGFYYDHEKNRYFPLANRPKNRPPPPQPSASVPAIKPSEQVKKSKPKPTKTHRSGVRFRAVDKDTTTTARRGSLRSLARRAAFSLYAGRKSLDRRDIIQNMLASSDTPPLPTLFSRFSRITSFAVDHSNSALLFGSDDGAFGAADIEENYVGPCVHLPQMGAAAGVDSMGISCGVKDRFFLTGAANGSVTLALRSLQGLNFEMHSTRRFRRSLWCSQFVGEGLVIGLSKQVIMFGDIERFYSPGRTFGDFLFPSDVLALAHYEHQVFAGGRSGLVSEHDLRIPSQRFQPLIQAPTSVTDLTHIRDWELMTTLINGEISIYDVRSLRTRGPTSTGSSTTQPVLQLAGNQSTISLRANVALYPSQDFVFVAGEDQRIRAWNTRSGALITPPAADNTNSRPWGLLTKRYALPITGVQIRDAPGEAGPQLWVASGNCVERWELGKRMYSDSS
ncbi:hypothetical protein DL93DRAFT_2172475 [Clavulina sp. PMI_390]|nr:hypothetical protein DL93DRAFT_2172475 [Clavulina sp. PMI_390]